jgi:hypothetical protein
VTGCFAGFRTTRSRGADGEEGVWVCSEPEATRLLSDEVTKSAPKRLSIGIAILVCMAIPVNLLRILPRRLLPFRVSKDRRLTRRGADNRTAIQAGQLAVPVEGTMNGLVRT